MHIVADESIPLLDEFFGDTGSISRLPGRTLGNADLANADVLLVRSITRVDQSLLQNTPVKFVGTATIGTDHIDIDWLMSQGIQFAAAPGCNAQAVVQYLISCISLLAEHRGVAWNSPSVGIVGCGNVGGRLRTDLTRLGFKVVAHDPFLQELDPDGFSSLEAALECDLITLHTPLTRDGAYPTYHLLNRDRLQRLRSDQVLVNTCRGSVVDNQALLDRLEKGQPPLVVLDVWENEPLISAPLLSRVWIGTPHIAGYTLEGKVNGTEMIYQALSRFLGLPVRKKAGQYMPDPPLSKLTFTEEVEREEAIALSVRAAYDPRRDDVMLRRTLGLPDEDRARAFDHLRKTYRVRREFSSMKVQLKGGANELQPAFRALGFKLSV